MSIGPTQEDLLKQAARELAGILDDALIRGTLKANPEPATQTWTDATAFSKGWTWERIRAKIAEEMAGRTDCEIMTESEPENPETLDFELIRTENGQVWRWEHQNDSETA